MALGLKGRIGTDNLNLLRKMKEHNDLMKMERNLTPDKLRKLIKLENLQRSRLEDIERKIKGFQRADKRR